MTRIQAEQASGPYTGDRIVSTPSPRVAAGGLDPAALTPSGLRHSFMSLPSDSGILLLQIPQRP